MRNLLLCAFCLSLWITAASPTDCPALESNSKGISWQKWNSEVFSRAKRENKLILLDLEAIWCHWCHVMDERTYGDPRVRELLAKEYLAVKVNQEQRPDLSNRYEDYGWPATIIFAPDGRELAKRGGFVAPDAMVELLERLAKNRSPESPREKMAAPLESSSAYLTPQLLDELTRRHYASLDLTRGGIDAAHKFLNPYSLEFALRRAGEGNAKDEKWARTTLLSNMKLIDPVWGGAYQYSTHRDWDHPHYEKISSTQARNIKLYAYAYSALGEKRFGNAAAKVAEYLRNFLLDPHGAFYTSQDADVVKGVHSESYFLLDDGARRAQGIPAIDRSIYARENGFLIAALASLYAATGDAQALSDAVRAAKWVMKHRALPRGGFRHSESDTGGPFLGDSLGMLDALLTLYMVTGERSWLSSAASTGHFIDTHFKAEQGLYTAVLNPGDPLPPVILWEENIIASRLINLLYQYTGEKEFHALAESAHRYGAHPARALERRMNCGLLLADYELQHEPLHLTVVGAKDDPAAKALYQAALRIFSPYRRIEWWDRQEGPLPRGDVTYPELDRAACFICSDSKCSLPIFDPAAIGAKVSALLNND